MRQLAKPLSRPRQKGAFPVRASMHGNQSRTPLSARTPASRSSTSTWTWSPFTWWSVTRSPKSRAMRWYRSFSATIAESHASNGVPLPTTTTSRSCAADASSVRKRVQLGPGASQLPVDRRRVLDLRLQELPGDLIAVRGMPQHALHALAHPHRSQPMAVEEHELLFDAEPSHANHPSST